MEKPKPTLLRGSKTVGLATAFLIGSAAVWSAVSYGTGASLPTVASGSGLTATMWNDLVAQVNVLTGLNGPRFQYFSAGGTFTVPANVTTVYVTAAGGGGGGAGGVTASRSGPGGGAGSAVYRQSVSVTPAQTIAVAVWAGGAGGAGGAAGGAGGTTTFWAISLPGGGGGAINSPGGGTAGGAGGQNGGGGTICPNDWYSGGDGGNNVAGGFWAPGWSTPSPGIKGGGGGGGSCWAGAQAGSAGGTGFVLVEW